MPAFLPSLYVTCFCHADSAGKWGYYAAWLYLSTCMAVFLVRTLKRAVFQEVRNYGGCTGATGEGHSNAYTVPMITWVEGPSNWQTADCA